MVTTPFDQTPPPVLEHRLSVIVELPFNVSVAPKTPMPPPADSPGTPTELLLLTLLVPLSVTLPP